jgi:tRNA threonylcarbamoyladenosine biosynthesis protein TsaB
MPNILCIESSTTVCSVAIGNETGLLTHKEVNDGYTHAENLHVFIDEVIKQSGLSRKDIHAVAVGKGPGSYTGLRIGVSAAKGIAYALNIPLFSMNTLLDLCVGAKRQIQDTEITLCPMLDARRMEVYAALYDYELKELKSTHSLIINEESLNELSENGNIILFGDGANKCAELIKNNSKISILENIMPSATNMVDYCVAQYNNKQLENVAYFEPFYLKEFFTGGKLN